jgi:hypothetical protein
VLPSVAGIPADVLADRLTLAWLDANQKAAKALVERLGASLDAVHKAGGLAA